jgi:hypothetical protein
VSDTAASATAPPQWGVIRGAATDEGRHTAAKGSHVFLLRVRVRATHTVPGYDALDAVYKRTRVGEQARQEEAAPSG